MKKTLSYFLYTMLIACIVCACSDSLDITQKYSFDLLAMPYPKRVVQNETVEMRLWIVKSGNYAETKFYIRYFQTGGKGELRFDDNRVLTPNDLFPLTKETFRLYYTSRCTDQQNFDIYMALLQRY
ncbi:conjugal transfer protein [Bacteroidia bacterium]|nr:conjugal transfer protein [Bacteroidia bacterium]